MVTLLREDSGTDSTGREVLHSFGRIHFNPLTLDLLHRTATFPPRRLGQRLRYPSRPPAPNDSNDDLSNVEVVVAVTLPGDEQAPVMRRQPGRTGACITHGDLVDKPLDAETARAVGKQGDLSDVEVVVAVALPRYEQVVAGGGEGWRLGARLVEDELAAEVLPAIGREHDVEVVVAVAPPGDEQALVMRRQRRCEGTHVVQSNFVRQACHR